MTNKEKAFKKAFKHRHVTNVELQDKGKHLIVAYRYTNKKSITLIKEHVMAVAGKFETLEHQCDMFANSTKNYEYNIAHFKVTK